MSTLLMVTPYPPYRDGIGAYAVQEVRRLRAEGVAVEVLSPLPSAAHHHLALGNLRGVLALGKRARRYQSTMIQFSPEMFFGACRGPLERVAVWGGLAALAKVTELEIRLHEIEFGPLARNPAERFAAARALRAAAVVSVHTEPEIDRLSRALSLPASAVTLVEHGRNFVQAAMESRSEARAELGLRTDRHQFLAIGFLQEHKGFDRAADAFRAAGLAGSAELHIVGSVRVNHPDLTAYARSLDRLCQSVPGVTLHQRYVSDAAFDRWILAADTVVLPYREIWSSSVLERAKLLDRPIVAADVGGLRDQAPEGTLLFDDDQSLVQCLKERVAAAPPAIDSPDADAATIVSGSGEPGTAGGRWTVDPDRPDRRAVEAQLRARARARTNPVGSSSAFRAGSGRARHQDPLAPLLAVEPLERPEPVSARPGVSEVKRLLRRLINWELEPVVLRLDELRTATTEAVARIDAGESGRSSRPAGGRWIVEEPFVHGALADVGPGARILLIGDGGSPLAAALAAGGHRLSVVPPGDEPPVSGGFDVLVDLSDSQASSDGSGLGTSGASSRPQAPLLVPDGRMILAIDYGPEGQVGSLAALSERLQGLQVVMAHTAGKSRDGCWKVETHGLPEDDPALGAAPRLVLVAARPAVGD